MINRVGKLQLGLTPYPPLLEERGDKSPFLAHFQKISQARNWGEKGNFSPPLLKERGLGGEAQLQLITTLNICKTEYKYFIIQFYTKRTYNYNKMKRF